MVAAQKVEHKVVNSEEKYNPSWHGVRLDTLDGQNIAAINLETPTEGPNTLSITLQTHGKGEYASKNLAGLLSGAGIENVSSTETNSSTVFFRVSDAPDDAIIKTAVALSNTVENGKSDYHYPMLDAKTAGDIIEAELKHLGKLPSEAGLAHIETETLNGDRQRAYGLADPVSYVYADITHPNSAVSTIRENATPTLLEDDSVMHISSTVYIDAPEKAQRIKAVLGTVGKLDNERSNKEMVHVEATADQVAEALKEKGLIPDAVADEIISRAKEAHPDQREVNQKIYKASQESLKTLVRR